MPNCRHCQKRKPGRPRGLCFTCYYTPGVRGLYPSISKYARRGVHDYYGQSVLPPIPTPALPGSAEKIAVLQQRATIGVDLWHPDDALLDRRTIPREVV